MVKINFQNNVTKCNADTFNTMQDNIENGITAGVIEAKDYADTLNTYSTTEQVVGTWIDGKPLYRVVVSTTTPSSSNVTSIGTIASLNYNKIISLNGMLYTANQSVPLNWLYSTNEINSLYVEGNNIMCKITASSYQSKTCYVILEYTKTTD